MCRKEVCLLPYFYDLGKPYLNVLPCYSYNDIDKNGFIEVQDCRGCSGPFGQRTYIVNQAI